MGMIFYITKDKLLMSEAFDFTHLIACLNRIEHIMNRADFLEWRYEENHQIFAELSRFVRPGIYTQEVDNSVIDISVSGYVLGFDNSTNDNIFIGYSSRGYGSVDHNGNVFLGIDEAN